MLSGETLKTRFLAILPRVLKHCCPRLRPLARWYARPVRSKPQSHDPEPLANIPAHGAAYPSHREFLVIAVFVLFSSLTFFLIEYDRLRSAGPDFESWAHSLLSGTVPAPDQYRIALPLLTHFLEVHAHLRVIQSLPIIEGLAYTFALTLLYILFRFSPQVEKATLPNRVVLLGFFLAAAQFPILWIFPWARPETLPTAFYLAAIVLLIVHRSRIPFAVACVLATLLSLGEALMRADVPVVVGAAVLLAAAMATPFSRPRSHVAALGLLCAAIGGGVQLYLQRIVFPTATYPASVPRVQLLTNLSLTYPPLHLPIFFTALLPLIVTVVLLRRHHLHLDSSDKLVLLICLLYLPLWISVGLVVEVRIFVPFLFLASPTMAKIWAAFLSGESDRTQPHLSAPTH